MLPERWGAGNRGVAKTCKACLKPVVGNADSLFQTGHALPDLHIDPYVGGKGEDTASKDNLFRNDVKGDLHVFVACRGRVIVKFIDIKDKEASIGSRYGAVEKKIGCCEAGAISCGNAWEIQFVTTHGDQEAMGFCLMILIAGDKSQVSHGATVGDITMKDEENSVCASWHASANALRETAYVVG